MAITVNPKYLDQKGIYVFCRNGIYWALTPEEVQEMNQLTGELLASAKASGPNNEETK